MPNFEAIGDVSLTLKELLLTQLGGLADPQLHDLVVPPSGTPPVLSLFLYDIIEDGSARNRASTRTPQQIAGQQRVRITKPSLTLMLRYMLTAWAGNRVTEHRIIGRVLQTFHERPTLSGPQLLGSLANTTEALKLTLLPISLDERSEVWEAIRQPYRLSLNYEVRVVHIDSELFDDVPGVIEQVTQPARVEVVT